MPRIDRLHENRKKSVIRRTNSILANFVFLLWETTSNNQTCGRSQPVCKEVVLFIFFLTMGDDPLYSMSSSIMLLGRGGL